MIWRRVFSPKNDKRGACVLVNGKFSWGRAYAVSRPQGLRSTNSPGILCVDSYNGAPQEMDRFKCFNPFYFNPKYRIPVPGTNLFANSIESVWQGLKIVDNRTDFPMFESLPYKRPPREIREKKDYSYQDSIFLYKGKELDIVTARYIIYLPTYLYAINNLCPESIEVEIWSALKSGKKVYFYDWDDNFDITNSETSFSHSSILASWFNGTLDEGFLDSGVKWLTRNKYEYLIDDFKMAYIQNTSRYTKLHQNRK